MSIQKQKDVLAEIPIEKIDRNPENPRLFFREQELIELTDSIRKFGVRVPISVFKEKGRYILIDGERRWRASLKLNKKTVPAIIQDKPDALQNLLLMFNIHALREQWDLLTISIKLPKIIELYALKNKVEPNEKQLSEETGLSRSLIRRCRLLMDLPEHHIDNIKSELKKPKSQQKISEDFYIELERSLTTVARAMPQIIGDDIQREQARQAMLEKYRGGVIKNLVDLRKIAKIARASVVGADVKTAEKQLKQLFSQSNYSIDRAFEGSVSSAYSERDTKTHIERLLDDLSSLKISDLDEDTIALLEDLVKLAQKFIRSQA